MADWTVGELAADLRVSEGFLYQRARRREIPHMKLGSAIRFTPVQVEQIRAMFEQPAVASRQLRGVA